MPHVSPSNRPPASIAPMRHLALGFMGSVVLFAAACGGKVVVDAGGNGGSGGAGSVVSTGVVSPAGVVSVSTGGGSLCEQVCSSLAAKGCDISQSCVTDCQSTYPVAPKCAPLFDNFLLCALKSNAPTCNSPPDCAGESQAFEECVIGAVPTECEDLGCAGNGGSCSCKAMCGSRVLAVECTPGNATDFCTCLEEGVTIGQCTVPQMGMMTTCDILEGCCVDVFFP